MNCADCNHPEENHKTSVCNGDITCFCQKFIPSTLVDFANEIELEKKIRKNIYQRCKFILTKIPPLRNAGEKSFYKAYIWIWHDFKIKKGTNLDSKTWKTLPNQDTVNREKRRVKQLNEDLRTYDKEVLYHQTALYQTLMEMAMEGEP